MADTVSWDQLRDLAGFRARQGCAISIFLNLDPALAATAPETATKINSLLDEAEKQEWAKRERLSHEEREGLKADFELIFLLTRGGGPWSLDRVLGLEPAETGRG